MRTNIEIHKISSSRYEFKVIFTNDTETVSVLPAQRLQRAAARIGLLIQSKGRQLEAIEFEIISYANIPREVDVKPMESYIISLFAEVKKIGKTNWGLIFEGATYKIDPEVVYEIQFSQDIYRSETVEWSFSGK